MHVQRERQRERERERERERQTDRQTDRQTHNAVKKQPHTHNGVRIYKCTGVCTNIHFST